MLLDMSQSKKKKKTRKMMSNTIKRKVPRVTKLSDPKVGDIFYIVDIAVVHPDCPFPEVTTCNTCPDEGGCTPKTASIKMQEWFVTCIRTKAPKRFAFHQEASVGCKYISLTQKVEHVTWGKKSTKVGDRGWLPYKADGSWKRRHLLDSFTARDLKGYRDFAVTKKGAYKIAIAQIKNNIRNDKQANRVRDVKILERALVRATKQYKDLK